MMRRVVGGDGVYGAVGETFEKCIAIVAGSERRDVYKRQHMRTGAYILSVGRVADATLVRGLYP